jgi:hypothetical protein
VLLIHKDGFNEEITKGNMIHGTAPYVGTHITTCCTVINTQQSAEPYTHTHTHTHTKDSSKRVQRTILYIVQHLHYNWSLVLHGA